MKNLLVTLLLGCLLAGGLLYRSRAVARLRDPSPATAGLSLRPDELTPVSGRPTLPPIHLSAPLSAPARTQSADSPTFPLKP